MRHSISVLISPDFFEVNNNDESTPEKILLAAILWRAYWDLQPNVEMQFRLSAIRWFEGLAEIRCGFTYQQIIDTLNISFKHQEIIKEAIHRIKFEPIIPKEKRKKGEPRYNVVVNRVRYRVSA